MTASAGARASLGSNLSRRNRAKSSSRLERPCSRVRSRSPFGRWMVYISRSQKMFFGTSGRPTPPSFGNTQTGHFFFSDDAGSHQAERYDCGTQCCFTFSTRVSVQDRAGTRDVVGYSRLSKSVGNEAGSGCKRPNYDSGAYPVNVSLVRYPPMAAWPWPPGAAPDPDGRNA